MRTVKMTAENAESVSKEISIATKIEATVVEFEAAFFVCIDLPTGMLQKEFNNRADAERFAKNTEDHLNSMIYHCANAMFRI